MSFPLSGALLGMSAASLIAAVATPAAPLPFFAVAYCGLSVAAFLRCRSDLAFGLSLLWVVSFAVLPSGWDAALQLAGQNPTRFARAYGVWITLGLLIALMMPMILATLRAKDIATAATQTADGLELAVNGVGKTAAFLSIPLMLIIAYDITQRKLTALIPGFTDSVFFLPSTPLQEFEWHLHGAILLLSLGFCYVRDGHVRIEVLRDLFSPRLRAALEAVGIVLFLFSYCLVMVRFGVSFAERAFLSGESSAAMTGLGQRWIIKSVLPLGFVLLATAGISSVLRCLVFLFGPSDLHGPNARYAGGHHADLPDDVRTTGPIAD